jgi:hypothetical protein
LGTSGGEFGGVGLFCRISQVVARRLIDKRAAITGIETLLFVWPELGG